jgi:hypothetical protein
MADAAGSPQVGYSGNDRRKEEIGRKTEWLGEHCQNCHKPRRPNDGYLDMALDDTAAANLALQCRLKTI